MSIPSLNPSQFSLMSDDFSFSSPRKRKYRRIKESKFTPLKRAHSELKETEKPDIDQSQTPLLKWQLSTIEQLIEKQNYDPSILGEIRIKIGEIVENGKLTEQQKLAELGLFYNCLFNEKSPSMSHSFLTKTRMQMEREISQLKMAHSALGEKEVKAKIPSGVVAYLHRSFAPMIWTADGNFNLGGCYAVKELLNTRLALFLTEEMRTQILTIVDLLIQNETFRNLFAVPFEVDPKLKKLIAIDLNLPLSEPLNFIHVRWDLLMALFSIVGQYGEGNCFAIASNLNLLSEYAEIVLRLMIDLLKTGKLFFEGIEIPMEPLLEQPKRYEKEFTAEIEAAKAHKLAGFCLASSLLGVTADSQVQTDAKLPLHELINHHFGQNSQYVKEIFLSHKQNLLQRMALRALHFIGINSCATRPLDEKTLISFKRGVLFDDISLPLLEEFFDVFNDPSLVSDPSYKNFIQRFDALLQDRFYFIDNPDTVCAVSEKRVVFESHLQGLEFDGDLSHYEPFAAARRLFYFSNNEFFAVDSLSFLACCFKDCLESAAFIEDSDLTKHARTFLKDFVMESQFKLIVARSLERRNSAFAPAITHQHYLSSDSLFYIQTGGDPGLILNAWEPTRSYYGSSFSFISKDPLEFFENLCQFAAKYVKDKPEFVKKRDPQWMLLAWLHACNLQPHHFKKYWDWNPSLIKKTLINPGKLRANKRLDTEQKKRVLAYCLESQDVEAYLPHLSSGNIGVKRFRQEAKSILTEGLHIKLDQALDRVLQEFAVDSIEHNLMGILDKAGVPFTKEVYTHLLHEIAKKTKTTKYLRAYDLAKYLHRALLKSPKPVLVERRHLEEAIRETYFLPQIIDLGNLNWVTVFSEKVKPHRLALKYDLLTDQVVFCVRENGKEAPLSEQYVKSLLNKVELFTER